MKLCSIIKQLNLLIVDSSVNSYLQQVCVEVHAHLLTECYKSELLPEQPSEEDIEILETKYDSFPPIIFILRLHVQIPKHRQSLCRA